MLVARDVFAMWIDTHCHLSASEFAPDAAAVVARARAAGVEQLVLPAVDPADFAPVQALARRHGLAYALGLHPLALEGLADRAAETAALDALEAALDTARGDPQLVAVGEIGLDHFVPGLDRARQERMYAAQLGVAARHGLPVLLHVRRSADSLLKQLRRRPGLGGIAHAFNGSAQQAQAFVDRGFALGFGGALVFERALQLRALATHLPAEALVLETDAPDIPPPWLYRRAEERAAGLAHGRNEPAELPRIAHTLAALRGWDAATTAAHTCRNACRVLPRLAALRAAAAGDGVARVGPPAGG